MGGLSGSELDSDIESDAGASPSYSESSSSVSSRASSPGGLRIVCDTPKPVTSSPVPSGSKRRSGSGVAVSVSGGSKDGPKRRKSGPPSAQKGTGRVALTSGPGPTNKRGSGNDVVVTPVKMATPTKRKKRQRVSIHSPNKSSSGVSPSNSVKRRRMNIRRRTKSERNTRFGKVGDAPVGGADGVALDAEIDKFLEEKAMKNNLTATNVKSIIHHVVTNNMVQKLMMTCLKKRNPDDSSGEEGWFEPKLTRARTKHLLQGETSTSLAAPLWQLTSPGKPKLPNTSETHVLMHEDLRDDSSGEEYVPKEDEIHSDDESSSIASIASDVGSPCVSTPGSSSSKTRKIDRVIEMSSPKMDTCFKTPAPLAPLRPKCARQLTDNIGLRTRSKLPLNDTPLQELEKQFIPPDITTDMYDWGISDNEDYLDFLKDFLNPGETATKEGGVDEEADPDYNICEEEDKLDKEELRMDRAVKVSKKELNALVAELLEESQFSSGDEIDESEYKRVLSSLPGVSDANSSAELITTGINLLDTQTQVFQQKNGDSQSQGQLAEIACCSKSVSNGSTPVSEHSSPAKSNNFLYQTNINDSGYVDSDPSHCSSSAIEEVPTAKDCKDASTTTIKQPVIALVQPRSLRLPNNGSTTRSKDEGLERSAPVYTSESDALFTTDAISILEHQLRQHVQLLAQSYAMTVTRDEVHLKKVAQETKRMLIEVRNLKIVNGPFTVLLAVTNCDPASQFVNSWPIRLGSRSPLKKKILVEHHINESQNEWAEVTKQKFTDHFPRSVAKAIVESDAFIYPDLLPQYYDQDCQRKLPFFPSEDNLLIYGIDELKDFHTMNWKDKAKVIAAHMVTGRPADALYHRIRNLRKKNNGQSQTVLNYLEHGILPEGAKLPPKFDPTKAVAPIHRPKNELPDRWWAFMQTLLVNPARGRGDLSTGRRRSRKSIIESKISPTKSIRPTEFITTTFHKGTALVQEEASKNPERAAIPLKNSQGHPEVYIFVPRTALPSPISSKVGSSTTFPFRKFYHPIPLSSPEVDMQTSPRKKPTGKSSLEVTNGSNSNAKTEQKEPLVSGTPVGKQVKILPGVNSEIVVSVPVSTFTSPLKKSIMERVERDASLMASAEAEAEAEPPSFQENSELTSSSSRLREDHSARTFGLVDDAPGPATPGSPKPSDSSGSSSSSSSSGSDSESSDSSSDSGNEEESLAPPQIITIEDSPIKTRSPKKKEGAKDGGDGVDSSNQSQNQKESHEDGARSNNRNVDVRGSVAGLNGGVRNSMNFNQGHGDDDEDDDEDRRHDEKHLPEDAMDDDGDKEDETEDDPETEARDADPQRNSKYEEKRQSTSASSDGKRKRGKRGSNSPPKKRSSQGIPVETMLEEDLDKSLEVCDAFLLAFIEKVKTVTEVRNPGTQNEFIKILCEHNSSEKELVGKASSLLKDYPELVAEFSTFMQCPDEGPQANPMNPSHGSDVSDYEELQAQIRFQCQLEKLTEKWPHLKAKIVQKLKALKETPTLKEKDIVEALTPLCQGNQVMINAVQAMYPSVYAPGAPGSEVEPADFEEVDMESEAFSTGSPDMESVALPEEKTVPATTTCPCTCHDTSTHAYSSRVRHCNKCCVKDGKVFAHSGRIVRPVHVEMTPPPEARKIIEEQSVSGGRRTIKGPQTGSDRAKMNSPMTSEMKRNPPDSSSPVIPKQIKSEDEAKKAEMKISPSVHLVEETKESKDAPVAHTPDSKANNSTIVTLKPWTMDEDRLVLTTFSSVSGDEDAFKKLDSLLPQRDRTEIESRWVELVSMLQQSVTQGTTGIVEKDGG